MTRTIYGLGYSGRKLDDLVRLADELDALVVDVRFSPRSRNPEWSKKSLTSALGSSYHHLNDFGNRDFKGDGIDIVNYERGKAWLETTRKNIILMCVCKNPTTCHRSTLLKRLADDGFEVQELNTPPRVNKNHQLPLL